MYFQFPSLGCMRMTISRTNKSTIGTRIMHNSEIIKRISLLAHSEFVVSRVDNSCSTVELSDAPDTDPDSVDGICIGSRTTSGMLGNV